MIDQFLDEMRAGISSQGSRPYWATMTLGMDANVRFVWRTIQGCRCLVITFEGRLTKIAAQVAAMDMRQLLLKEEEPCQMVWDCRSMTGYDAEARSAWQEVLKELRWRVAAIHVLSESRMIRLGASAVALFTGLPLKAWTAEDDIAF